MTPNKIPPVFSIENSRDKKLESLISNIAKDEVNEKVTEFKKEYESLKSNSLYKTINDVLKVEF